MDTFFKIISIISPFISAYLIYIFAIKGKRKDISLQKEMELNTVLSNLLLVWHFLSHIETIIRILNNNNTKSIIPKKDFPIFLLKTGYFNDGCFSKLDNSIEILKKYDPIIFYKLEGIGNIFNEIRKNYIMPFFKNPETELDLINIGAGTLLYDTLDRIEEYIEIVAEKLNTDILSDVREIIHNHRESDDQIIIDEINKGFYELIINLMNETETKKPTYEEFLKEATASKEFKQMIDIQLKIINNNTLPKYLDIIASNPNITIEELNLMFENENEI